MRNGTSASSHREPSRRHRAGRSLVAAALLTVAAAGGGAAHEVPANVAVQIYVRPQGNTLRLLIRAPLAAMRDLDLPLHGPGYLDFDRLGSRPYDAARIWIADYIRLYEGDTELPEEAVVAVTISLPSDRSFASYDSALAHILSPGLPPATELVWDQARLDVLLEVPINSADSRFSMDPMLAHLGVQTVSVVHFVSSDGAERVFQYDSNPGLVRLDPRWYEAAATFVGFGFRHILDGLDHLLFVLCLVIPIRRIRPLVAVITSFTVAHSITLIAAALGLAPTSLWFPPLIETLIAVSIVYMALENIVGARLERRWIMAFGFGLVHGFGFSFALRESLQFAGSHLLTALLSFNVGVELGQLLVIGVAVPVFAALFRWIVPERTGGIIVSAILAHGAWHWMTARAGELRQYRMTFPSLDVASLAGALRWLMLLLIVVGVGWLLSGTLSRLARPLARGPVEGSELGGTRGQ
ncbi:MAG TPA: HupE/UreJ family protein [Gemmatimonadaceae bacterium]